MTSDEATGLVLYEGGGGDERSLHVLFHGGEDPGPERMRRLLAALRVVFDAHAGKTVLDRGLAAALWAIGNTTWDKYWQWPEHRRAERPGLEDEVVELITAVESVFLGTWFGAFERPTS